MSGKVHKVIAITSPGTGTFTPISGISNYTITCIGAGGGGAGGGSCYGGMTTHGEGGGRGGMMKFSCTLNGVVDYTIGTAGAGVSGAGGTGVAGNGASGATTFGRQSNLTNYSLIASEAGGMSGTNGNPVYTVIAGGGAGGLTHSTYNNTPVAGGNGTAGNTSATWELPSSTAGGQGNGDSPPAGGSAANGFGASGGGGGSAAYRSGGIGGSGGAGADGIIIIEYDISAGDDALLIAVTDAKTTNYPWSIGRPTYHGIIKGRIGGTSYELVGLAAANDINLFYNYVRVRNGGTTYCLDIVDTNHPQAGKMRIKTHHGIKAGRTTSG